MMRWALPTYLLARAMPRPKADKVHTGIAVYWRRGRLVKSRTAAYDAGEDTT